MRINLFAGPSAGKSTTAAWLFSELKTRLISVELVTEYVKFWSYLKRNINHFDQVYLFGKQMQYEYRFLSAGVQNVVTDSPTLLSAIYADFYYPRANIGDSIRKINSEYEKNYPSFNIFLERKDKPYVKEGRYQTYDQAKNIDDIIRKEMEVFGDNVIFVPYNNREAILKKVLKKI